MANTPTQPQNSGGTSHVGLLGIRGRNGFDAPLALLDGQCREALNVDWYQSSLGRKRMGADAIGITGGTAFTSGVRKLGRFVPGSDETLAELWAVDGGLLVKRLKTGTSWADVSMDDAVTSIAALPNFATLNGKYFFAYKSGLNRMHVYDPVDNKVRRCGLAVAAAPTVANTGSGSYAGTIRYYKQRYTKQIGGVTVLQGELSPAVSFTPSGSGTAARITKAAAISEGETHWELFGSPDNSTFNKVATTVVGTTTYDDSVNPTAYPGDIEPDIGSYFPPPAAKYIVADDARLIMTGAHETAAGVSVAPTPRRVWWTSILGSSGVGDDERVSITDNFSNYADLEEATTGISQPVNGTFIVFSYRSQWKFVATGTPEAPYSKYRVTGGAGCISHDTIITASDASGSPSVYWWSERGPMRAGQAGQQFIGQDILDLVNRVNLGATVVAHAVSYPLRNQIWFYIAVDGAMFPNRKVVFDTFLGKPVDVDISGASSVRYGWSVHDGESAKAYCSCMFAGTLGAAMSLDLKPFVSYTGGTAIWECESATTTDDAGTAFQAYVQGKLIAPWGLGRLGGMVSEACLVAKASFGVSAYLTIDKNDGEETITSSTDMSPATSTQRTVVPKFDGSDLTDAALVSFKVGDITAISNSWNLYALTIPTSDEGDR